MEVKGQEGDRFNDLGTVIIFKEYYFVVKENVTIFAVSNKKESVHATTGKDKKRYGHLSCHASRNQSSGYLRGR